MKTTTKKALVKLKELRGSVESALYDRIDLCRKVLADKEWIGEEHGGDEFKARDELESQFFPDLKGFIQLDRLLNIFAEFPSREQWTDHRYSLQAMNAAYRERFAEAKVEGQATRYKPLYEEALERISDLEFQIKRERASSEEKAKRIEELLQRVSALELENAKLQGRLEQLLAGSAAA